MENLTSEEIMFVITRDDLQFEAIEKIGRLFTEDEIEIAKKGLQFGLLTAIDSVYNCILFDMIKR